ncbi:hypothetical protein NL108_018358 [Boleophthalmus pectinirostris]|nr:hypothetical protein NL108_018359 [Boleophthalmus pectinirostris]KAJ0039323.1 hypothetical protein NL108_018358 [Boleophthalmus pectinirostris]
MAVGKANSLLCKESILIGCQKNAELVLVYVPLSACRDDLGRRFNDAVVKYSCVYAWCFAQGEIHSPRTLTNLDTCRERSASVSTCTITNAGTAEAEIYYKA